MRRAPPSDLFARWRAFAQSRRIRRYEDAVAGAERHCARLDCHGRSGGAECCRFFASESPLNLTVARSSWNSPGLPEPGSLFIGALLVTTNLAIFAVAAFFEIAGCFAFWMWLRRGVTSFVALLGITSVIGFAVALTCVDSAFAGRTYAAYGGIHIAASLVWLWAAEGQRPTVNDIIGASLAVIGALVIGSFASRAN